MVGRRRAGRRGIVVAAAGALTLVAVACGAGVMRDAGNARAIAAHWRAGVDGPRRQDAFVVVALGDSAMQGIGAANVRETIAGRAAAYVAECTGRTVDVRNYARGGATIADVLAEQLPNADTRSADLVLVASSNDLEKRNDVGAYAREAAQLAGRLPRRTTIWSDLPSEPGRAKYQRVLARVTDARQIQRAGFAAAFSAAKRFDVFSWLPPHLNGRGYDIWFRAFRPGIDAIIASS